MKRLYSPIAAVTLLALSACAEKPPASAEFDATLPASYEREAAGANSLIRYHLDLLPGGGYQLRSTYLDKPGPNSFDSTGAWTYDAGKGVVTVEQPRDAAQLFAVAAKGGELRPLDAAGKSIEAANNPPFKRLASVALIEVAPPTALRGTYWKLAQLGGAAITLADGQLAPDLTLSADEDRVAGYAGCNRYSGGFTLDGDQLAFSQLVSTRMACIRGGELEAGFQIALGGVASYRIDGGTLLLLDAGGGTVATFEAAEPPQPAG